MDTTVTLSTIINLLANPALAGLIVMLIIQHIAYFKNVTDQGRSLLYLVVSLILSGISVWLNSLNTTPAPTPQAVIPYIATTASLIFVSAHVARFVVYKSKVAARLAA